MKQLTIWLILCYIREAMFNLKDFFHLPVLDAALNQMIGEALPGMILVAGVDTHAAYPSELNGNLLTSGRSVFFDTLMQAYLGRHRDFNAILVAQEKTLTRLPRGLDKRVKVHYAISSNVYIRHIASAVRLRPDLLIIDRFNAETAPAIFEAAEAGLRVLTQLDTILFGAQIPYQLLTMGVETQQLDALSWIVSLLHLPALCPKCKRPALPLPGWIEVLRQRYPHLADQAYAFSGTFHQAPGCANCHQTGRSGHVTVFDVYQVHIHGQSELLPTSMLPRESYLFQLAAQGHLPIEDVLHADSIQAEKLYHLFSASQRSLIDKTASLHRKLAELEAANQVLLNRTEVLISLQDTLQLLTSSSNLSDLAARVCRRASEMCGAERVILYYLRGTPTSGLKAEVLAVSGWDPEMLHQQFDASLILSPYLRSGPTPLNIASTAGLPPSYKNELTQFHAALQVPLIAQNERIGLMVIHATQKRAFTPGETSLLQTFANQAALAIQRAGLIEELQAKITQLEAAQAELLIKERLEHELDLARQVQQNVLPKIFPALPGFHFAAHNEPARQVGGDFYDVIVLDDDHLGIIIADVSDKGMPAALYMALTRSLLLAEARRSTSPRAVLENVNRLLLELGQSQQFVSVFYGVVNRQTHQLVYARAGHDRPLLVRGEAIFPLSGRGMVLGIFPDVPFFLSEEILDLQPGDRLVLYTDGLTDTTSPEGQFYGLERLVQQLHQCGEVLSGDLCAAIFQDLRAYQSTSEQFDDMTMLVMEFRPQENQLL
jgi:serine phosphatase RsbU (regulator of sigma subunit)